MDRKPVLSLIWAGGKLGGAYFDFETYELFMLSDTPENPLDFEIAKLMFRQVDPGIILFSTRQDPRLIAVMKELTKVEVVGPEIESESESGLDSPFPSRRSGAVPTAFQNLQVQRCETASRDHDPSLPPSTSASSSSSVSWGVGYGVVNSQGTSTDQEEEDQEGNCQIINLPGRDFAPDPCKARIQAQRLPWEHNAGGSDHLIFMTSLISFKNLSMVRATGALLGFLDRNGVGLFGLRMDRGMVHVADMKIFQLEDLVLVDDSAWSSLQIFNEEDHPAPAKVGGFRSTKEGLSVYSLLDRCLTLQGSKLLRLILLRPTRNEETLKRRLDVIEFCTNPLHMEFVKSVSECLKCVKSWPNLIGKMESLNPSVNDWNDLYQTVYNIVLLADVAARHSDSIHLFSDLCVFHRVRRLRTVAETMARIIDFEESKSRKRFVPKTGVNHQLDNVRKRYSCLPKIMTKIAEEEIQCLPAYIVQCSVVYIPEIGYLLAVNYWAENLTPEELQTVPGLEYKERFFIRLFVLKFSDYRIAYYKSRRTQELDEVLGDYQTQMLELETNVKLSLIETIVEEKSALMAMGSLVSELDCLIAMSKAASEYGFVRPTIVDSRDRLEIIDGKHPLVATNNFVPNSTTFAGQERIVILTGPNASGKSVYLKQVGIITLMALSGSFVPAASARIPLFDRILTKIHLIESVSFGLSTFLIDMNQMASALRESSGASLVIVDEFGKGTAETDGMALLIASLNDYIKRGPECPTLLLSTHFYSLMSYMERSELLKFQVLVTSFVKPGSDLQTMEFIREQNQIIYLYKLIDGMSQRSFASVTAAQAGISEPVLERFEELHEIILQKESDLEELENPPTAKQQALIEIGEELLTLDLDAMDPVEYCKRVMEKMRPFRAEEEEKAKMVEVEAEHPPPMASTASTTEEMDEDEVSQYFRTDLFRATPTNYSSTNPPSAFVPRNPSSSDASSSTPEEQAPPQKRRLVSYTSGASQSSQGSSFRFPERTETATSDTSSEAPHFRNFKRNSETPAETLPGSERGVWEYLKSRTPPGNNESSQSVSASSSERPIPRGPSLASPNFQDFSEIKDVHQDRSHSSLDFSSSYHSLSDGEDSEYDEESLLASIIGGTEGEETQEETQDDIQQGSEFNQDFIFGQFNHLSTPPSNMNSLGSNDLFSEYEFM